MTVLLACPTGGGSRRRPPGEMSRIPKNILIAVDSFKGSLSSAQVCAALAEGIRHAHPEALVQMLPLSDGGEGFLNVFQQTQPGELVSVAIAGPLGQPVMAHYFVGADGFTVIEMAQAAGLMLIPEAERNPFRTTTYGLGQLIRHALEQGLRDFIIGIGGSATVDCGAGMAQALGYRFFDESGAEIRDHLNGEFIGKCRELSADAVHPAIQKSHFRIACDVTNPLLGPEGAVYTYAVQKGATPADLPVLEENMCRFSNLLERCFGREIAKIPGTGAAGGLGAGALAFLDATLRSGIELILDTVNIEKMLKNCDLVITGEGKIDRQSLQGKAISGVIRRARRCNIPVIGVTGKLILDSEDVRKLGLERVFSLTDIGKNESQALQNAGDLLIEVGRRIASVH